MAVRPSQWARFATANCFTGEQGPAKGTLKGRQVVYNSEYMQCGGANYSVSSG